MNPEKIVEEQVEAYNERNINKFLACHDLNVELYNFSESIPFAVGRAKLKEIYEEIFANSPNLNTEILSRIIIGNKVIDHEKITGRKGIETLEMMAIYEIENGLIAKAHFIRQ